MQTNSVEQTEILVNQRLVVDCKDVESHLGALRDGDLDRGKAACVEAHISSCDRCRRTAAEYDLVIELAAEIPSEPVPVDVQNRLRAALNRKLGLSLPFRD